MQGIVLSLDLPSCQKSLQSQVDFSSLHHDNFFSLSIQNITVFLNSCVDSILELFRAEAGFVFATGFEGFNEFALNELTHNFLNRVRRANAANAELVAGYVVVQVFLCRSDFRLLNFRSKVVADVLGQELVQGISFVGRADVAFSKWLSNGILNFLDDDILAGSFFSKINHSRFLSVSGLGGIALPRVSGVFFSRCCRDTLCIII
nr:MAG TPA: hypothetical protein [Caudoviricetes sp.]